MEQRGIGTEKKRERNSCAMSGTCGMHWQWLHMACVTLDEGPMDHEERNVIFQLPRYY